MCCVLFFSRYSTVMFSTGPMFLTHEATQYSNRSSIQVLSQELYGKYVYNNSESLFQHLKGIKNREMINSMEIFMSVFLASSWHGNDAMIIKWIYRQRMIILLVFIIVLIITFALIKVIQHHHILSNRRRNNCSTSSSIKHYKMSRMALYI